MNEVKIFSNSLFGEVRVINNGDEPMFCLADVCRALGLEQVSRVKSRLKSDGVITSKGVSLTTNQYGTTTEQVVQLNFINEPNLYKCIFMSRKAEAEKFQDWVTSEVLPSVRKHGAYLTEDTLKKAITSPDFLIQLATSLKEEQEKRIEAEEKVKELEVDNENNRITIELQKEEIKKSAPKVNYYNDTLQSVNTLTSTQIAKEIRLEAASKLNQILKSKGIIYKQSGQWLLHSPYSKWGMHSTRTQTFTRSDGSIGTEIYTVWTQRGRRFIHALNNNGWDVRKAINEIKGEEKILA